MLVKNIKQANENTYTFTTIDNKKYNLTIEPRKITFNNLDFEIVNGASGYIYKIYKTAKRKIAINNIETFKKVCIDRDMQEVKKYGYVMSDIITGLEHYAQIGA